MVNVLPLEPGETVTAMVVTREFDDNEFLMMVTRNGTVKRIPFISLKTNRKGGIRAITLDGDDHLINVIRTNGNDNIRHGGRHGHLLQRERCPSHGPGRRGRPGHFAGQR